MSIEDMPEELVEAANNIVDFLTQCMEEKEPNNMNKKTSRKIPNKSNVIMFEDSIDKNGEVSDRVKDILQYAEKCDTPLFSSDESLTVVESSYDLEDYRISRKQLNDVVDENMFRNRTNIIIDDFDYNLSYMGYENVPNDFLSIEVIENEFGICDLDIAARMADILNFSLKTNMFLPMLDPIVDCAYIKCEVPEGKEDIYGDEETITKIVEASATVLSDIVQRCEELEY